MVSEGEVSGSSATGSVKATWRRTGVTGMVTPTMSPMPRDQAPAAQTTVSVAMRPHSVTTAVMVPLCPRPDCASNAFEESRQRSG